MTHECRDVECEQHHDFGDAIKSLVASVNATAKAEFRAKTAEAERDALRATLDRVRALAEDETGTIRFDGADQNLVGRWVRVSRLRAALEATP